MIQGVGWIGLPITEERNTRGKPVVCQGGEIWKWQVDEEYCFAGSQRPVRLEFTYAKHLA